VGVRPTARNPASSLINWLMPGNFSAQAIPKEIGDWFGGTASATNQTSDITMFSSSMNTADRSEGCAHYRRHSRDFRPS
jgi:hypothetical protein